MRAGFGKIGSAQINSFRGKASIALHLALAVEFKALINRILPLSNKRCWRHQFLECYSIIIVIHSCCLATKINALVSGLVVNANKHTITRHIVLLFFHVCMCVRQRLRVSNHASHCLQLVCVSSPSCVCACVLLEWCAAVVSACGFVCCRVRV